MSGRGHELIRQVYRPNEAIDPNHIVDHELGSGRSSNVYVINLLSVTDRDSETEKANVRFS